jgi:hypothetical protein
MSTTPTTFTTTPAPVASASADTIPATPAIAVAYDSGPAGEVVATDAALAALARTRTWVLLLAIMLFVVAGVTGLLGGGALIGSYFERNSGDFAFLLVAGSCFLVVCAVALTGAILLMRYWSAAARAYRLRRPEDLERALIALHHLWRYFSIALIAAIILPAMLFAVMVFLDGNFP